MKIIHCLALVLTFLLVSCHETTEPICKEGSRFDPQHLEGVYSMVLQDGDTFEINKEKITLEKISRGSYKLNGGTVLNVCKFGELTLAEAKNENGSYSSVVLTNSENYFQMVSSTFDIQKLNDLGIPYQIEEREVKKLFFNKQNDKDTQKVIVVQNENVSSSVLAEAITPLSFAIKFYKEK